MTTSRSERIVPRLGKTVFYRLSEFDAHAINRRRDDDDQAALHQGNRVRQGDVFPMVITRLWTDDPTEDTVVQGQVMLDGNDCLWATSVKQGTGEREWAATAL